MTSRLRWRCNLFRPSLRTAAVGIVSVGAKVERRLAERLHGPIANALRQVAGGASVIAGTARTRIHFYSVEHEADGSTWATKRRGGYGNHGCQRVRSHVEIRTSQVRHSIAEFRKWIGHPSRQASELAIDRVG